jgi:hypothetical protein
VKTKKKEGRGKRVFSPLFFPLSPKKGGATETTLY